MILNARDFIHIAHSRVDAFATGNGGNIFIDPILVVRNDDILAANAINGRGGNIEISAGAYIESAYSVTDVSSLANIPGTISNLTPDVDVAGNLAVLPEVFANIHLSIDKKCSAQIQRASSRFILGSRDSKPFAPGDYIPSY